MATVNLRRATLNGCVLMLVLAASVTAQERFQFCGGRDLIHAMIKVCSRSLPDELAPPAERPSTPESTTTTTATTTSRTTKSSLYEVDEYLTRLNMLLELMYAASELNDSDAADDGSSRRGSGTSRVIRSTAARGRYRRSSMQRAKQVARKCCDECTSQDIQSLCW